MKTKADARTYFLNIIDEATKKGVALSETKNADYRVKFDTFLDTAQKYIANIIKIPDVFQVTQNPIPNMQGLLNGFDIVQILPDEPKTYTFTGCKALYFEIDNVGTVTIAINGIESEVISNTIKRQFTAYKRLTGASTSDTVTLTFSGDYPYNIRNTGFYEYAFSEEDDIPTYSPYVAYDMPNDFLGFDSVVLQSDPRVYRSYVEHRWESTKKVVLNYYDEGSFDIYYFKYPATIDVDADDTTVLDIEDKAFDLVVLYTAVLATSADNTALSSWLRSLYIEKVQNVSQQDMPLMNSVETIFSIS